MGGAGAVAVDDRRQPLHVGTQDLGEGLLLGLAQLRELLGDMRHRAVVLADLDALDRPADPGRGGRVAGLGQRVGDPVGGAPRRRRRLASAGSTPARMVSMRLRAKVRTASSPPISRSCRMAADGQIVVGVLQLGPAGRGQLVALGGPAAALLLPGRCGVGLRVAGVDQSVEVAAHPGCGHARAVRRSRPAVIGPGLQQQLDDGSAGVTVVGRRTRHRCTRCSLGRIFTTPV